MLKCNHELRQTKIKTADFLGKSRWKFKIHDNSTVEAKILDEKWLARFHARIITIGSGDSIEILGALKETFDEFGKCIDRQYIINEIVRVIKPEESKELEF